ncbi:MAG: T9SS type A sorting domain-containing protein [Bacteroidota bacterium]
MKQIFITFSILCIIVSPSVSQETWILQWETMNRTCLVDFPSSRTGQTGLPVVFNLHPYDWTASQTRNYLKMHLLGDSVGFITIYPSASDLTHWNSGISDNPSWVTPNSDDVGFISKIIDSLIVRYTVDTSRMYSCGYSNGGFMSLKLAGQLGNRIAAIASVSGILSNSTAASYKTTKPVPALFIHGTSDGEVPYSGGKTGWYSVGQTIEFIRNKNLCLLPAETLYVPNVNLTDQSTVEKYAYRSSTNLSNVILFKVIGGRHVWPDAPPLGSVPINRDINASREIWNFFKLYTMSNVTTFQDFGDIISSDFTLSQNYPNPFNPSTTIRYSLPSSAYVKLTIHDILGREIATLVNEEQSAGWKEAKWNATGFASGMYLVRMRTNNFVETKKILLMK